MKRVWSGGFDGCRCHQGEACFATALHAAHPSQDPQQRLQLAADFDLQDILILNLQRAVQISTDIATTILAESSSVPSTMAEAFLLLHRQGVLSENVAHKLAKSVGLRNIAIHEYTSLDWNVVYAVAHTHIEYFAEFGREISAWVKARA